MPTRREALLRSAAAWLGSLAAGTAAATPEPNTWPSRAFAATSWSELQQALALATPEPSTELQLSAPELAENAASVPLSVVCSAAGLRQILILVEHNPAVLAARFELSHALAPMLALRVKMRQSAQLQALALLSDGRVLRAQQAVQITQSGCAEEQALPKAAWLPEPMSIRAQRSTGQTQVRVLMRHPMESGQRQDGAGQPIAAWFIQHVSASLNGQELLRAQWGPAVARDPFLQFSLLSAQAADTLSLRWSDNHGLTRSDQSLVR